MRITVREGQSSVKDQGDRPTCASFAVTSLHEYAHDVLRGARPTAETDLSEEFLHYHCKKRDGLPRMCAGTTLAAAAASLAAEGQSLEAVCPYQPHLRPFGLTKPTAAALADARARLLPGLRRLKQDPDFVKESLRLGRPVIAVMNWYSNSYLAPLGLIQIPTPTDRHLGRHAVLIVEWEDESRPGGPTIVFKNSWGGRWGDRGFGRFGLDYFTAYGRELWGLGP